MQCEVQKCLQALLVIMCLFSTSAMAGFSCGGILTDAQEEGFKAFFSPAYSPSLSHVGGQVAPENFSKKITKDELKRLQVKTPIVAVSYVLTDAHGALLKSWLNERATSTVPGWVSTVAGIAAPQAWIGISADVFLQLVNASGDVGRLQVANLAGTVSGGGRVGVLEQVAKKSDGKLIFLFSYVYNYELNGKKLTTPLRICGADVVVS